MEEVMAETRTFDRMMKEMSRAMPQQEEQFKKIPEEGDRNDHFIIREKQAHKVKEAVEIGEIQSSKGLHQEYTFKELLIHGVECLAAKLVEMKKHVDYPLVYKLIRLVLVLPVSTASVERSFSAMKVVKNRLRNKMGDKWMNDCLVAYIEKEVLQGIDNELIVKKVQKDATRRGQLPKRF
ncbi:hypothetical protein OSB04_010682 [Centaurea solstitialis]|uniref:HAT C-terminal dimerisation domain-containing protein n=1 Tax=Centaurea solstitialis TaxID=347529 RepID=A0AA38TFM8_9ASTR|nr:hypothetical protein OSB04_010682 [Centaurea solstitialis]